VFSPIKNINSSAEWVKIIRVLPMKGVVLGKTKFNW